MMAAAKKDKKKKKKEKAEKDSAPKQEVDAVKVFIAVMILLILVLGAFIIHTSGQLDEYETALARAKALLLVGRPGDAVEPLKRLLAVEDPPVDPGSRAYWTLLLATALAGAAQTDEARALLAGVAAIDPRMEHAANDLERRIAKGRPPHIHF